MLESSKKGHNLLTNLLAWSKSQSNGIIYNPTLLNLRQIVNENLEFISNYASSKNITISASVSKDITVFADKNMFNTVIRNLLSNAIKFTPDNGRIEISSDLKENEVEILISDTGIGMSPEDIDKLFRIDINPSSIGTAKEKGSGLGLILCKEFIEKNGGSIRVESEVGKGSQFYLRLPLRE